MDTFKEFLVEGKLKAEDYEAAIVIGWHKVTNQDFNPNAAGISPSVYDMLQGYPDVLEAGVRIATAVQKHFKLGNRIKAEQYGRAKASLTSFWKSHGGKDITPKTDILIGDKRLSLKIGTAQLMSGGKNETTATLMGALEDAKVAKTPQVQKVQSILENFVTASVAPTKLRPLIKSGTDEVVNKGEKAHKEMMMALGDLFESNRVFKIAFAREAMSGFKKYGEDSNAAAEFMLVATHDGKKVSIKSVFDDAYCAKIADRMKLQARFKTSSKKLKGVKTGEYNYWSVVSLIVNSLDEETSKINPLVENVPGAFKRAFAKIKSLGSKIKGFVRKKVSNLASFLNLKDYLKLNHKNNIRFD